MSVTSFDEESKLVSETTVAPQNLLQGMSGWLVKKGLAANQTSADLTLVIIAVVCIGIAAFFIFRGQGPDGYVTTSDMNSVHRLMKETTRPY